MNSIVMSPPTPRQARGGILVIEPDSSRAATLRDALRQHDSDLEIVESVPDALRSLAAEIPDLLLTSTFLPPADEASLTAHLKAMPAAAHLQIVTVPYFIDSESAPRSWTTNFNVLDFRQRRAA
jgi:CheY-like chemotaxis protein